jgi:hypothetical protein
LAQAGFSRTAGEVRFVKDRAGDKSEWAWNTTGPSERYIDEDFIFNAHYLKPLAQVLRSTLMALGHATSAHTRMVKIKSRDISPDGALGGKGYIQKIPDMRRQLMNCVEVLSALSDTIYDELKAPHWDPAEDKLDARDREEVKEIVEDAEDIKEDPEGWAREEEAEEDADNGIGKKASPRGVLMARLQASSGALTTLLSSNLRVASAEQGALLQDLRQFTALTQEVLENYDV